MADSASIEEIRQEVHDIRTEQIAQGRKLERHDEAIAGLKAGHTRLLRRMDDLGGQFAVGVQEMRTDMREQFAGVHERLDRLAYKAGEDDGADQQRESQRSWVGIAVGAGSAVLAALVAMAGWWVMQ